LRKKGAVKICANNLHAAFISVMRLKSKLANLLGWILAIKLTPVPAKNDTTGKQIRYVGL